MEFGKIEKMDVAVAVVRSPVVTKVLSLEIGEGFVVGSVTDSMSFSSSARTAAYKAGRKVAIKKIEDGKYQVVRIS